MLHALKNFVKTALMGGLIVILPITIVAFIFRWVFTSVTNLIQPLTDLLLQKTPLETKEVIADGMVILLILTACFLVGISIKTRSGRFLHEELENRLLKLAPGYNLIKETVLQFLGRRQSPFSRVALVNIFGNETMVTAFITDEHKDGTYTTFVPTGPNPTSGNIFHMKAKFVHPVEVSIEEAMRSIISCGAGSTRLVESYWNSLSGGKAPAT